MNFEHMPELHTHWGYPLVWGRDAVDHRRDDLVFQTAQVVLNGLIP